VIPAVHVHMEGFTAFFKHPLVITGTQVSLPCPPYSTILGLISACAGRVVKPEETRVGYEFRCASTDSELEKTDRLAYDSKKGVLQPHREGQGILKRYIHFRPVLDLYVTNLGLEEGFKSPASTPCLGRSQDVAWITNVERVELEPREEGSLGPTMIPVVKENIPSLIVRCPEWFINEVEGRTRITGPLGRYQAMLPTSGSRFPVKLPELYHPSGAPDDHVVYLHKWLKA